MVYKLTKVYTNDTCHCYAQEYLPLAYDNVNTQHLKDIYHYFAQGYLPLAY